MVHCLLLTYTISMTRKCLFLLKSLRHMNGRQCLNVNTNSMTTGTVSVSYPNSSDNGMDSLNYLQQCKLAQSTGIHVCIVHKHIHLLYAPGTIEQ